MRLVYIIFLQVIERALTVLKTLPPNMAALPQQSPMQIDHTVFYRKQAWLVVKVMKIAVTFDLVIDPQVFTPELIIIMLSPVIVIPYCHDVSGGHRIHVL